MATTFIDLGAGRLSDGRVQIFGISATHGLWSAWKEAESSSALWTPWTSFPGGLSASQLGAGQLSDGRLQLFLVDTSGKLWSCWKTTTNPNASWTAWTGFPGTPPVAQITAGRLPDGRLQLFAVEPGGALITCWKTTTSSSAPWTAWTAFPGAPLLRQVAVAPLSNGELQLFGVEPSGHLVTAWKTTADPDASWTAWSAFPGAPLVREVAAAPLSDGQIQLFAIESSPTSGRLLTCWKATQAVTAPWTAWTAFPGAPLASKVAVAPLSDGRLQLWVVDPGPSIWSCWKATTMSDAPWTGWTKAGFEMSLSYTMQPQVQSNWCWSAVATSTSHYYNAASTWTQCTLANQQLGQMSCCQNGASAACNVPWYLDRALGATGNLDHWHGSNESFEVTAQQIEEGRPLGVRIGWKGGGGHFVVVSGYDDGQMVTVRDPIYGTSYMKYTTLATNYQGSGSWTDSLFTKAGG
jgi:hypothetical protein